MILPYWTVGLFLHKGISQRKISNSFNGCLTETVVRTGHWTLIALYNINKFPNGSVVKTAEGKDVDLLSVVLQQMNLTLVLVPTPEGFQMGTKFNYDNDCKGSLYCFR